MRPLPLLAALLTLSAAPAFAQSFTISEEDPPASCDNALIARSFLCEGDFCDNITFECQFLTSNTGRRQWTHWVESDGRARADCADPLNNGRAFPNTVMTGLACRGGNCDDVSVECTFLGDFERDDGNCFDITVSDGDSLLRLPFRTAIRALTCEGRHCDNVTVTLCAMVPR